MNVAELETKPLSELHDLAKELDMPGFVRLAQARLDYEAAACADRAAK